MGYRVTNILKAVSVLCGSIGVPRLYFILCAIVLMGHVSTLGISPLPWPDEVQIIESGRITISGENLAGSMFLSDVGMNVEVLPYLGGVMQEIAYRLTQSMIGPRVWSLFGLFVAAGLWIKVLKKKHFPNVVAYGMAALFLVDPLITQNVRGARVDVWTTSCMLLSVLLISEVSNNRFKKERLVFFAVGILVSVQLFTWPSSILQCPLIFIEFIMLAQVRAWKADRIVWWSIFSAMGVAVGTTVILLPLYRDLFKVINDHNLMLYKDLYVNSSNIRNIQEFIGCCLKSPFICLTGVVGIFSVRKAWPYAVPFVFVLIFITVTKTYVHRVVHVIPYFIFGLSIVALSISERGLVSKIAVRSMIVASLLFGLTYSVVLRNGAEFLLRNARSPDVLANVMQNEIGKEGVNIYADTCQVYYAGRQLSWHQYRYVFDDFPKQDTPNVFSKVDWYLCETMTAERARSLEQYGFKKSKTITIPSHVNECILAVMRKIGRPIGYGPYLLYRKMEIHNPK